jgi:hypothetical protein
LSYQHLAAGKLCSGLLVSIHPGMLVNFPRNNHSIIRGKYPEFSCV